MKNILIITSSGEEGGVEKITYTLFKELEKKNNLKVLKIYLTDNEVYSYNQNELFIPGNKVLSEKKKIKKIYRVIKDFLFITYYKKKYKIDVSLSIGEMATLLNGLSLGKDLKIGSIHGKKAEYKDKLTKIISKIAFRRIKKLICINKQIVEETINQLGNSYQNKIKVIYNPHNYEEIIKKSEEKLEVVEERIFKDNQTYIFVGRIDENKGLAHLMKLFKYSKNLKNKNLVIIGPETKNIAYKNRLEELKSKNIYFLGRKENPFKYIKNSKALLMASYSEGLPNVMIESLIIGIPVVTTLSTKGVFEILEPKNYNIKDKNECKYGIVVNPFIFGNEYNDFIQEQEEVFIAAIEDIDNKKIEKISKKFDLKKIIKQYEKEMEL